MSIVNDEARDDNLSEHEGLEALSKNPPNKPTLNVKAAEILSEQGEMVFARVEGGGKATCLPKSLRGVAMSSAHARPSNICA